MSAGSSRAWETTVSELLNIFRDSLLVLIAPMERANISWRKPDAYDDWDEIAQALYKNIVIRSVEFALPGEREGSLVVPQYGLVYDDYGSMSFVEIIDGAPEGKSILLFSALDTVRSPFDHAVAIRVNVKGKPLEDSVGHVLLKGARFRFRWRVSDAELRPLERLSVVL